MAKIKRTMTVSLEEFGKKAGEYALDEFEYNGLTIRQWADKITSGEYQPVKHGKWISQGNYMWLCSYCKENLIYSETDTDRAVKHRYCSRCGAKMDVIYQDDKIKAVKVVGWEGDSDDEKRI